MELNEFIKATLVNIALGVKDANDHLHELLKDDASRSGNNFTQSPFRLHRNLGDNAQKHPGIDFDICVNVDKDLKKDGSGKVTVLSVVDIGGGVESSESKKIEHRIKFTIGVHQDWD